MCEEVRSVKEHALARQRVRRARYNGTQIIAQRRVAFHQRVVVELIEMQRPARVEIDVRVVEVGKPIAGLDGVLQQAGSGDQRTVDQVNAGQSTVERRSDEAEQGDRKLLGERMHGTKNSTED